MSVRSRCGLCAALLCAAVAPAQQLTISAPKSEFYLGELIPLELKFTASEPKRFAAETRTHDRVGRMNYIEEFLVEPASQVEDPLEGSPAAHSAMGGISGGPVDIGEKPFTLERILNEWIRFRKAGEYRIHVLSRRVHEGAWPAGKALELVSNTLTLEMRPAPAEWVAGQVAEARKSLGAADHERAVQALRSLDSLEAARELAREADVSVLSSRYQKQLLPFMEELLVAPGRPVSDRFLDILSQLGELVASGGPMPPYPKDAAAQKAWQEESKRRADVRRRKLDDYAARLVGSLSTKEPEPRAISLSTLLNVGVRGGVEPAWLRTVIPSLIAHFHDLPGNFQNQLLDYQWQAVKGRAMLPLLREVIASGSQLRSFALRRLYELAPDEARKVILDEIRRPGRGFDFSTLSMLPDASLPELDEALIQNFDPMLILRYASGAPVKRVEQLYLARPEQRFCAGPLAFYFLKFDPAFGERLLRADFAKIGSPPVCYDIGFQFSSLGSWAYSPALERLAIESLMADKVPVKRGAAEVLGKYGTPAARKPLWEAMEYFRNWWKDREQQLMQPIGEESRQLEVALRTALARADGWVLDLPDLQRLRDLCSSEWCRRDLEGWTAAAGDPIAIQVSPGATLTYSVGQYGPADEAWLRRKLAQYPAGTAFRVVAFGQGVEVPAGARDRVVEAVNAAGYRLIQ